VGLVLGHQVRRGAGGVEEDGAGVLHPVAARYLPRARLDCLGRTVAWEVAAAAEGYELNYLNS